MAWNFNCVVKTKVTCSVKVAISPKWCKIETLSLYYTALIESDISLYRTAAVPITLSDLL